ncbi:Uncharacterized membrane protein [Cyclobacterium lianum]|uniref:Uncharacterized membrane protein n=1 Tax=Cyclobacterium lianum TaxID=388280 RepID=A0A1M7JRW0_9BACT|nr:anthrone oxygenase family protein [Cyclobacterium lianum]SHM55635.1 Uncharacterized membrane protein [Cyclobacterium lianum]
MDISIKTFSLIGSVILTGLSAGLFLAWSVSVIPGTKKLEDLTYLATMQSINRAILNPGFFLIFFGSLILLCFSFFSEFNHNKLTFWLLLFACTSYLIGTIGATGIGNVPLNDQLEALNLSKISQNKMSVFRKYYETNWNRLHQIRTVFALVSFVLALLALCYQNSKITSL